MTTSGLYSLIGLYDVKTGELLERCTRRQLQSALAHWNHLGYQVRPGLAYKNFIVLTAKRIPAAIKAWEKLTNRVIAAQG